MLHALKSTEHSDIINDKCLLIWWRTVAQNTIMLHIISGTCHSLTSLNLYMSALHCVDAEMILSLNKLKSKRWRSQICFKTFLCVMFCSNWKLEFRMFKNHPESCRPEGRCDSVAHQSFYRGFTEGGSLRSRPSCLGCENARVMVSPFWVCRFLLPYCRNFLYIC